MSATPILLQACALSKRFPGVRALHRVNLELRRGEVLAVIGENGAGKSTLMKILAGLQEPDSGEIRWENQRVRIGSVRDAEALGIALIHQELNLADNLDVAGNIFLGREPRRCGFVQRTRLHEEARQWLGQVGLECSPSRLVSSLSLGHQQMVEIAKALSTRARVLIMDEPTSSLSQGETEQLYRVVKDLRARGVTIVYISHRLGEVKELADRVVVLRDGQNAGELAQAEIHHDAMVRLMVGRDLAIHHRASYASGEARLEARGLQTTAFPRESLNFTLRPGEIVGLAGLVGSGRTELLRVLFGIDPSVGGEVRVDGQGIRLHSPQAAIGAGLALVPEDRKQQGVFLEMAVQGNVTLPSLARQARSGFRRPHEEKALAEKMTRQLRVKSPNLDQLVQFLSGGNQQKIVLAKWLALQPKVLLLDEPTRGIDVGAKQDIYQLLDELAAAGMAILFASSEMEEVLRLSDRAFVMHQGAIRGELQRQDLSEEAVMHLATGGQPATNQRQS